MSTKKVKITDLIFDQNNANKGTARGNQALEDSLQKYGAGRSILIDKNNRVIAGNKTLQKAGEIGLDEIVVVQTDGKKIVAVQRLDLDLENDPGARELAYADNRVGQLDLEWDMDAIIKDLDNGIDLSSLWNREELDELVGSIPEFQPVNSDEQPRLDEKKKVECPECGHKFIPS